jgi:capsular polysaccharide biosynthesis protein
MSKLSAYLDRAAPGWRGLCALGGGIIGTVPKAASLQQSRTVTLQAVSFDEYCARMGAASVLSGEALLADGSASGPRLWICDTSEAVSDHSRVLCIEGMKQPPFAGAPPAYQRTRQAFLRLGSPIVYPRPGLVMPEPGVVLRNNLMRWHPDHQLTPGFVDFVDDALVAREDELRPRRHIRQSVLVLCHVFHHNYAHWLIDCLPFLLPWLEPLQRGRLALLVPPLNEGQRRTLEILGVPAPAIIEASDLSILCDDAVVPGLTLVDAPASGSAITRLPQPGSAGVEVIRTLRAGASPSAAGDRPERIYVTRRGVDSFRTVCNEDEVETAVRRLGFVIVRPQDLSFDDQVAAFSRARIIAGPHGAGLTNCVFAPAGCLVVDVWADTWNNSWMVPVTQLFGHYYLPLEFPADAERSQPVLLGDAVIGQSHFYTVDIETLISALESTIQRLGIERAGVA